VSDSREYHKEFGHESIEEEGEVWNPDRITSKESAIHMSIFIGFPLMIYFSIRLWWWVNDEL